ncbi:MAG: homoserine dehydrogenase, partial [Acidimicrobiaceae bacterium]|nr:homoserine dehydrogenase [Acidimicrobiaceae bacterium]
MEMQSVRIGLLGFGNVGGSLVGLINEQRTDIAALTGIDLTVTRVAVSDLSKPRPGIGDAV